MLDVYQTLICPPELLFMDPYLQPIEGDEAHNKIIGNGIKEVLNRVLISCFESQGHVGQAALILNQKQLDTLANVQNTPNFTIRDLIKEQFILATRQTGGIFEPTLEYIDNFYFPGAYAMSLYSGSLSYLEVHKPFSRNSLVKFFTEEALRDHDILGIDLSDSKITQIVLSEIRKIGSLYDFSYHGRKEPRAYTRKDGSISGMEFSRIKNVRKEEDTKEMLDRTHRRNLTKLGYTLMRAVTVLVEANKDFTVFEVS